MAHRLPDSAERRRKRYRTATRATGAGLIINAALGVTKLVAGIIGNSFALIADAVNSLGDVFTSIVILFAFRVAQKPPDKEHPYGHTRAEAIAGSNVAILVMVSALIVGWHALRRLNLQHDLPPSWTLWIAGGNAVIKETLFQIKIRIGRRIGSVALLANAWDHRSDALCSLAVLVGLGVVRWGGEGWIWADEVAAIIVVIAILWSASRLFQQSAGELMDAQADPELIDAVRSAAMSINAVKRVESLRMRKSGLEFFLDIHIEVEPDLSVHCGHAIGHDVKDLILERFDIVRDVLVHIEPAGLPT